MKLEVLFKRLRISNEEKRIAEFLMANRDIYKKIVDQDQDKNLDDKLKPFKFILVDNVRDGKIFEKITELLKYINRFEYVEHLKDWKIPFFPISGTEIEKFKIPKGPIYSKILDGLKDIWKNEFDMDTSEETVASLKRKLNIFI